MYKTLHLNWVCMQQTLGYNAALQVKYTREELGECQCYRVKIMESVFKINTLLKLKLEL